MSKKITGYYVRVTNPEGAAQNRGANLVVRATPYHTKAQANVDAEEMRRMIRSKGYKGYRVLVVQVGKKR